MKKMTLALSVLSAVALSSMASADSYSVQTSDGAGCSQNENTGRSIEFGADVNTYTQETNLSFMYRVELGKRNLRQVDCNQLYDISLRRQNLQLQREELEIELLRVQLANARERNNSNAITDGDDW
jgi:cell shape-determining protein MreC